MKLIILMVILITELSGTDVTLIDTKNVINFVDDVIFLTDEATSMLPGRRIWNQITNQVIQAAVRSCEIIPPALRNAAPAEKYQISIINVKESRVKSYKIETAAKSLNIKSGFDNTKRTVIYVPGWKNVPNDESTQAIVKSLVKRKNINVLVVNASRYLLKDYVQSVRAVNLIGEKLYKFLKKLVSNGTPAHRITIIGYSLGAHIAGVSGRLLSDSNNVKIGKITGLDPAGPCFTGPLAPKLSKDSANFVEVIHTSPGTLGLKEAIGHADFYVNGLMETQPECLRAPVRIACSHSMTWKLYVMSVDEPGSLTARSCETWNSLKNKQCRKSTATMGFGSISTLRGLFLYKSDVKKQSDFKRIKRFSRF